MSQKLGRYRLVKLLATGGMGEVFLARQEGPGGFAKMVVIKRILKHLAQDQGLIDLFLNEAKLAAQLQHQNIAQVFGLEHEANHWFISMEYVHGRSLREVLDRCHERGVTVPAPIAARLVSQALQGLHFAHELTDERGRPLGILHRDVSPENLLVAYSGQVKLVDFGIARAMTGAETRIGRPKGKLAYMAPELTVSGALIDRRADVYAAGVVLHELLTLTRPPCVPESVEALSAPRADYTANPAIEPVLNDVLRRALAAVPDARFASAHQMSTALEAWLASVGEAVLQADLARWLVDLFGREEAEVNPAVVHLGRGAGRTDLMQGVSSGTTPLSRESQSALGQADGRRNGWWLALIGVATASIMGFMLAVALWPRPAGVVPSSPQVAPLPVVFPSPPDAGSPPEPVPPDVPAVVEAPAATPTAVDAGPAASPRPRPALRPGRVALRVNPWAEVFLGTRLVGVTPLEPIVVPAGIVTFTLKNPQLGVTRTVTTKVSAGKLTVLKVDLFAK